MFLIQFIDVNIAGYDHGRPGPARIFGFVAARDTIEPLRNYVYKREISNCEAVSVKRSTVIFFMKHDDLFVMQFERSNLFLCMLLFTIVIIPLHETLASYQSCMSFVMTIFRL